MTDVMQQYNYWGYGNNEPLLHLKTKKQLVEIGLSPVKPVGFIETKKYIIHLYDPNCLLSTRPKLLPTPKQLENLRLGRVKNQYKAWYKNNGFIEGDRVEVVGWSRQLLTVHRKSPTEFCTQNQWRDIRWAMIA